MIGGSCTDKLNLQFLSPILTLPQPLSRELDLTSNTTNALRRASKRPAPELAQSQIQKRALTTASTGLSSELGEYINRDYELLQRMGWKKFVRLRRGKGDFSFNHPAKRLLMHYKRSGVPIKFSTPPWTTAQLQHALKRGPHKSCQHHEEFIESEFVEMIKKGQWVVLP